MLALKNANVSPEWVQIGNEIPTGMVYPEGHTDNWPQLAQLLNAGLLALTVSQSFYGFSVLGNLSS